MFKRIPFQSWVVWLLPLQLATFTDQASCPFRYTAQQKEVFACSRELLLTGNLCSGSNRVTSSPENEQGWYRKPKQNSYRVAIEECDGGSHSSLSRIFFQLDRFRTNVLQGLREYDSSNLYSHLLLGLQTKQTAFLRIQGWLQWLSISGIHYIFIFAMVRKCVLYLCEYFCISVLIARRIERTLKVLLLIFGVVLCGFRPIIFSAFVFAIFKDSLAEKMWVSVVVAGLFLFFLRSSIQSLLFYLFSVSMGMQSVFGFFLLGSILDCFHWHLISPWVPIFGLVLLPFVSVVVFPLLLVFAVTQNHFVGQILGDISLFIYSLFSRIESLFPLLRVSPLKLWVVLVVMIWVHLFLNEPFQSRKRLRLWAFTLAVIIRMFGFNQQLNREYAESNPFYISESRPAYADSVEQLDVSQGDSALIRYHLNGNQSEFYGVLDTGADQVLSAEKWMHLLSQRGIAHLDFVGFSHLDQDHRGGLRSLAEAVRIRCIAVSADQWSEPRFSEVKEIAQEYAIPLVSYQSDCFPFQVLESVHRHSKRKLKANENMAGFIIPFKGGGTFFSWGDADQKIEMEFLKKVDFDQIERPVYLKVSHHGSKTSSSQELISILRPELAVISSGVGNTFGHPSTNVLERFKLRNTKVLRTDLQGSVLITGEVVRHQ